MKQVFNHNFSASALCWANWLLEKRGEAIVGYTGSLYRLPTNKFSQYTAYVSPYTQMSYDSGVAGANVPSGVYLNSVFVPNNTSGMKIDYQRGVVYFSGLQNGEVTGGFTNHEINIYPTTEKEEILLFEKKYSPNPRNAPVWTGRLIDDKVVPCLFLKTKVGDNEEICLDGMMNTHMTARFVMVSDTQFTADGITSLFRDATHTYAPLLTIDQLPFDIFGNLRSGWNYNFYQTGVSPNNLLYLDSVKISEFTEDVNTLINNNCVGAIIDCNFCTLRFPKY